MNKRKWPYTKILVFLVASLGFIYLTVKIVEGILQTQRALNEDLPIAYSISHEDSSLFSEQCWSKLTVTEVYRSKVRSPIAFLSFDQKYFLIMNKMELSEDRPLEEILHLDKTSVDRSTGVTYTVIDKSSFSLVYKAGTGANSPLSQFYLTLSGDSLTTTKKNDSTICCHLLCENFSIRYEKDDPIDIFSKVKRAFSSIKLLLRF